MHPLTDQQRLFLVESSQIYDAWRQANSVLYFPFSETLLFGNAKEHGQAPLNLHQCININAPEGWPHLIALHGHGLVHHDL